MAKCRKTSAPKYAVDDRVRVRSGVTDPEYADLPLGGWVGSVVEVDKRSSPPLFLIRWSQETLRHIHPIYERRADRDGNEFGSMWLAADDLESNDGSPVLIEQPTNIVTKPLSMANQDDRIRAVFGLTSDDLIPDVDKKTLRTFHKHLTRHMPFPIEAKFEPEYGRGGPLTLLNLSKPDPDLWADGMCGLLCRANLGDELVEVALADCQANRRSPGRQLLADYSYWFGNFR